MANASIAVARKFPRLLNPLVLSLDARYADGDRERADAFLELELDDPLPDALGHDLGAR